MLCIGIASIGCQPDYVHVYAEGSSVELSSSPVTVHVDLYGDGKTGSHEFATQFIPPTRGEASSRYADFNVVLEDDAPALVDLRVSVFDTATGWSSSLLLRTPGAGRTLHLLLLAAESRIASARVADGESRTMALFSNGVVMAWLDPAGVSLQIERVADALTGRPDLIVTDPAAAKVRVASRPGAPANVGPELFALTWVGGDGRVRLMTQKENDRNAAVDAGEGDDVLVAVGYAQASYTAVTIIRSGTSARIVFHDEGGAVTGSVPLSTTETIRKLRALVTTPDGSMILAVETTTGWQLMRIDETGATKKTMPVTGQVSAITLSEDRALVHAAVIAATDGGALEIRSFYTESLEAFTADPTQIAPGGLLPSSPFGRVSIASCAIVWPQKRSGGGSAFDLWVVDLDSAGRAAGEPRLLNSRPARVHFSPTVGCITSTRAYASFVSAADASDQTGDIMLRKVPPAPVQ